jgi:molybdate transport system permease protein
LAFARALGEFGATLTFAGSLQGVTRTLPLEIYLQRVSDPDAAVALSLLLVAVAALVVLGLGARRLTGTDAR